jgi:hypothetical protein
MVNAAVTVMVNDWVAVWPPPVTLTVKVNVPVAVGVPLRAPVLGFSVIPPGNVPVEDHVNVPVPAVSLWL